MLQAKIDNAGGEPLRRQKDLVTKLGKKIADAEGEAAKKGVQIKAAAKQLDKLNKDVSKAGVAGRRSLGVTGIGKMHPPFRRSYPTLNWQLDVFADVMGRVVLLAYCSGLCSV